MKVEWINEGAVIVTLGWFNKRSTGFARGNDGIWRYADNVEVGWGPSGKRIRRVLNRQRRRMLRDQIAKKYWTKVES